MARCNCKHPVSDPFWPLWDGTCRRCGDDCRHRIMGDVDDGVLGGQGRSSEDVRASGAAVGIAIVSALCVALWALIYWVTFR